MAHVLHTRRRTGHRGHLLRRPLWGGVGGTPSGDVETGFRTALSGAAPAHGVAENGMIAPRQQAADRACALVHWCLCYDRPFPGLKCVPVWGMVPRGQCKPVNVYALL